MDVLTPEQRRLNMSRIRSRDTKPEKIVRSLIHAMGFRYSLHKKDLPGKPDIVLVRHRKIIEVYGCFFHMHSCKNGAVIPKTRTEFWQQKRLATVERDKRNFDALVNYGYKVLIVWECETYQIELLRDRLTSFLNA